MNRYQNKLVITLIIVLTTYISYGKVVSYDFVDFDDNNYILKNYSIHSGLNYESIKWAFSVFYECNWHPLTWLSHALDINLFGLNAGGHHLVNLIIHITSSLVLFFLFCRITGSVAKSGFAALLFALHPTHVESVAWVSERKDVLSLFLGLLTLYAYVFYVDRPEAKRYLLVFFLFCLGLMAKPMLVTLPCIMLLMDYWPLKRFDIFDKTSEIKKEDRFKPIIKILTEKIPFFFLSISSCIVTFYAQKFDGAVLSLNKLPFKRRVFNAIVSYLTYIKKMVWPTKLAIFYPFWDKPLTEVAISAFLLVFISAVILWKLRYYRYLTVGWLWFLITLLPVIGLLQVGIQSMADRYTYLPYIGLSIIISWGLADFLKKRDPNYFSFSTIEIALIVVMTLTTRAQVSHWKNTVSLFEHAVNVTNDNFRIESIMGAIRYEQGEPEKAIHHYSEVLRMRPGSAATHNDLAVIYDEQGLTEKAIFHYMEAIRFNPNLAEAYINLGLVLEGLGRAKEASSYFDAAIKIDLKDINSLFSLADFFESRGRLDISERYLSKIIKLMPKNSEAYNKIGLLRIKQERVDEAITYFSKSIKLSPKSAEAHNNLGLSLAKKNNLKEAITHFSYALEIDPNFKNAKKNLEQTLHTN